LKDYFMKKLISKIKINLIKFLLGLPKKESKKKFWVHYNMVIKIEFKKKKLWTFLVLMNHYFLSVQVNKFLGKILA